jgi:predicted nucleotidyltransferase
MIRLLAKNRREIGEVCRRFHVLRLEVFGSAAREIDFSDESDIDLLVEYEDGHDPPSLEEFFALRGELAEVLGRDVDLVMTSAVRNPYVRADMERSKRVLHAA